MALSPQNIVLIFKRVISLNMILYFDLDPLRATQAYYITIHHTEIHKFLFPFDKFIIFSSIMIIIINDIFSSYSAADD